MQIEVTRDVVEKLEQVSKRLGVKKEDLVDKALLLYLDGISKYAKLKKEMKDWDFLSDEALTNFEKSL